MYCKVIVTLPLKKEFIYLYPKKLNIRKGDLILVPFGQRKEQIGLVSEIISEIKINSKKFHKSDFYKLSKDKEIPISKIEINNKFLFLDYW